MNVKVEIELCSPPSKKEREEMYGAAEFLTDETDSIYIYQPRNQRNELVAEFTINKARQIDVVDRIAKEFSYNVRNYSQSSISFPKKLSRQPVKKSNRNTHRTKSEQTSCTRTYMAHKMFPIFLNIIEYAEIQA